MSARRLYLDDGPGERRGVATLDGRPERLLIEREAEVAVQALGARVVGRVRRLLKPAALAFIDLGEGPEGILNLGPETGGLTQGAAVEVEIRAEGRSGRGPTLRLVGPAQGDPRLLAAPPTLEERLQALAPDVIPLTGHLARSTADAAQSEALETEFPLPGGGTISIEPTRALVAIDVDLGERAGPSPKRASRAANLEALAQGARLLRLKSLGGLVVIDLVGRAHDAPAMLAAARSAFGADGAGVAFSAVSRFGTLELTLPRRQRPINEILLGGDGRLSALTVALMLARRLEAEAASDRGARLEAVADADVALAAQPLIAGMTAQFGQRLSVRGEAGRARERFEVRRL